MVVQVFLFFTILAVGKPGISPHLHLRNANECLHAWSEKMSSPSDCKLASDCKEEGASCVFSPLASHYICCRTSKDAVQPECPHRAAPPVLIVCDKNGSDQEEQCPSGHECVESVTDFEKYSGQSNSVCCQKL
uniref:Uncharacterized protein n=1 Tax=Ditylenchus dipsaci TaxID=166011 RepID=A0A915DX40_9BILA